MRLSQILFVTLREDPAEAEIPSHKLLLRAGYVRRIAAGIYAYLPLMWRVLKKISNIVREEMDATGAAECMLPQLQPAQLWRESGRWDTYQSEGIMFSLRDRQDREMGLGPTHEEVITAIARDSIRSYRQLPLHLYQIQTKFRDEIRPRFGLMRGREFIMKDGYSFHADAESMKKTYQDMDRAYRNIFRRCGLAFRPVEADSGAIGGSGSQEFMVLADAGEDEILYTEDGKYAANVEKAIALLPEAEPSPFSEYRKAKTPGAGTIAALCDVLQCSPTNVVKNVLYQATYDTGTIVFVLASIRGDRDVNEVKLANELTKLASNYDATAVLALTVPDEGELGLRSSEPLPLGYLGPDLSDDYIKSTDRLTRKDLKRLGLSDRQVAGLVRGLEYTPGKGVEKLYAAADILAAIDQRLDYPNILPETAEELRQLRATLNAESVAAKFLRIADKTVVDLQNFVTGANETDYHVLGANWGEALPLPAAVADFCKAQAGDRAIHDPEQILQSARGIEVGHIFQLGTKYSQAMGASYTTAEGKSAPLHMGCYGIGVSRLAQSAAEQNHDGDGIVWPVPIAPFHATLVVPKVGDDAQREAAERLYRELTAAGVETLLDDRDESAGVKFKDADLVGIPYRIVTGRSLKAGKVEVVERSSKQAEEIDLDAVISFLKAKIERALTDA